MPQIALTRHAATRANQRGVTQRLLTALLSHADIAVPVGGGCTVLRFSRERLMDRQLRDSLGQAADRLVSLLVITADDTGEVVTVMRDRGRADGRRYRRAA